MSVTIISVFIFLFCFPFIDGADETDISRLRAFLLNNYDTHARPVQNHTYATQVVMSFFNHGFEFDEAKGLFVLHCLPVFYWTDEHMSWDPLNFGNITYIQFSAQELWRPDIMVYNNLDKSEIDHFGNTLILAYNNSYVYWVPPAKFEVSCDVNFQRWPYDIQICHIVLGSWAHDGFDIDLTLRENHTELYDDEFWNLPLENREWKLVGSAIEISHEHEYPCCPDVPYFDIVISLSIQRKSGSHTAAVTVVAIGIAAAVLISFWLNPFAHERVPVILVAIFLNTVYLCLLYRTIPYNGFSVPYAVCFFRDSLMMLTVALGWTVFIRYIAKTKRASPVPLPDFIQKFLESFVAKILCVNPRPSASTSQNVTQRSTEEFDDNDDLVKGENQYQEDWAWLAHLLDRVAFFMYFFVYAVFFMLFCY